MRAWLACTLAVVALLGCRRPPKPAPAPPPPRTALPKPHLRGIHLGPGVRLPGDAISETLQQGWLCLDLPGAARSSLWAVPGKGLRFAQLATDVGPRRWDLMAVEPDDPTPTVLVRDVGPWPQPGPHEEVVFLRTDPATGVGSLWTSDAKQPEGRQLSEPGDDVRSFAVDEQRGTVWLTTQPGGLLQVSRDGKPAHVLETGAEAVLAVLADGEALVRGKDTVRIDAKGATHGLSPAPMLAQTAGAELVFQDHQGGLWLWPGPEREAVALPGATTEDQLLRAPGGPWIVHRDGKLQRLSWFDGQGLQPVVTLGPLGWTGAARLREGVVAALLTHDTDQSGAHDGEDESDVCLVASALKPLEISERNVPLALADKLDGMRALLASEGIAVRTLRFVRAEPGGGLTRSTRLQVIAQGPPPTPAPLPADATPGEAHDEPAFLLHWLDLLHGRLTVAAGDPHLGLDVEWPDADRQAMADWSAPQGRFMHRFRLGDLVLLQRDDYQLEWLEPRVQGDPAVPPWSEGVRNVSGMPLSLRMACVRGTVEFSVDLPEPLEPGLTHPMPAGCADSAVPPRFFAAGVELPVWDPERAMDTADWLMTTARVWKSEGFKHVSTPSTATGEPVDPGLAHDVTHFAAPQGFAELLDKDKRKLAKSLWTEIARHLARSHGRNCPRNSKGCLVLHIHDSDGHRWSIDESLLEPAL